MHKVKWKLKSLQTTITGDLAILSFFTMNASARVAALIITVPVLKLKINYVFRAPVAKVVSI